MASTDLRDLILRITEEYVKESLNTCIPAEVVNVSLLKEQQVIDAQPLINKVYEDNVVLENPVILDIPVVFPSGGGGIITFPIKKGDIVLLVFSMRSIDDWLSGEGDAVTPVNRRHFHMTDAIAIPGLGTKRSNSTPNPDDIEIKFNDAKFKIQPDNKLALGANGVELLKVVSDLLQALIDARTPTAIGEQPLANQISVFTTLKSQIDSITGVL